MKIGSLFCVYMLYFRRAALGAQETFKKSFDLISGETEIKEALKNI